MYLAMIHPPIRQSTQIVIDEQAFQCESVISKCQKR